MNEEQEIELLLKSAGKRPMPTQQMKDQIRLVAEQEWLNSVARAKKRKLITWFAPISTAAAAILIVLLQQSPNHTADELGVQIVSSSGKCDFVTQSLQKKIRHVETESSCSLVLNVDGNLVLVDANSGLNIINRNTINLVSGRIYVDSESDQKSVVIKTRWGKIEDIGTLFEVDIRDEKLQVTMREGTVKVSLTNTVAYAKAASGSGDQLTVDKDNRISKQIIDTRSTHWNWAQQALPPFHLEGKSADELARWASRVTGVKLEYGNELAKNRALGNTMSGGTIAAETIHDSLSRYLETAGLAAKWTQTGLVVELTHE